jgi:hypothetical protein
VLLPWLEPLLSEELRALNTVVRASPCGPRILLAGLRQYVAAQRKRPPEGSLLKENDEVLTAKT